LTNKPDANNGAASRRRGCPARCVANHRAIFDTRFVPRFLLCFLSLLASSVALAIDLLFLKKSIKRDALLSMANNFRLSYTQASGAFTPLWVAQQAGLFKKHGLDASLKLLNSQVALQALVAGEVDVISSGPDLVNARLQNVPVKYIGGPLQRFIFQLWGGKGIGSLSELKGKTIAVTTPRTSTEIATREALKKTGVISDKDVSFLYVQTIPAVLTAVMGGKTSAGTLSAPNTLKARDA